MSLRIIHLTDCHLFIDQFAMLKGIMTRDRWNMVLFDIAPELERVDRLIITGDFSHEDLEATYSIVRETLDPWWNKVRMVPGNHDVRSGMLLHCGDRIQVVNGRNVFSEELNGWRLIGLDSQKTGEVLGEFGSEQLCWLDQELTASPATPTALFFHHPPVQFASPWMNAVGLVDRDEFWNVIDRHPQVQLICNGHVHHESTHLCNGVSVLTTPATGVQFRPETEVLEVDPVDSGYRIIELNDDTTWRTRVVRVRDIC